MKVLLDTNVLASAFSSRGLCADVLRIVLADHELLIADVVLVELDRVLRLKFRVPTQTCAEVASFLRQHTVVPRPSSHLRLGLRDPSDEWVVASANAARANIIVTGDRDLLEAAVKLPVPAIGPRAFWNLSKTNG
ncbi:MAG: putative toxin-antitoxin system toxin component, PIN family [Deltaproteobacteria bacterium]|nr:putative toxin-antitoxin system toxin component, PIN family [Deltaproteobacteria bacterium]